MTSEMDQAEAGAPALSEKVNTAAEWLPISSAPKDGTAVELLCAGGHVAKARWGTWNYISSADTWWCAVDAGWTLTRLYAPTLWRPLPSPPGAELTFSNEPERDPVSLNQSLHHTQSKEG